MCKPGTDEILRASEAQPWHDSVVAAIKAERVPTELVETFCELAGVIIPQTFAQLRAAMQELKGKQTTCPECGLRFGQHRIRCSHYQGKPQ